VLETEQREETGGKWALRNSVGYDVFVGDLVDTAARLIGRELVGLGVDCDVTVFLGPDLGVMALASGNCEERSGTVALDK
jgi:hypothetical protein